MFKIEQISGSTGRVVTSTVAGQDGVSEARAAMRASMRTTPARSSDTIRVTPVR